MNPLYKVKSLLVCVNNKNIILNLKYCSLACHGINIEDLSLIPGLENKYNSLVIGKQVAGSRY